MVGVVVVVMIAEKRFQKSSPFEQFEADTGQAAVSGAKALSEGELPAGLRHELLPKHVAVIADGSRRCAIKKGMPSILGHGAGMQSLLQLADLCCNWGIEVLNVFLFSTENWVRPRVSHLSN
ncbi:dehydrodolichyl diphosphate synthase 2-like [Papaver somniferum]|uniref:dehydrodolichyl diphosphate synthase 2-like n=1 Tax=Papaver somniferum TaxID=3469 RepID=UPI000E6F525F|nr:dehydrodolichyl diphosphate synthase 2-like [Papaver somniferum]